MISIKDLKEAEDLKDFERMYRLLLPLSKQVTQDSMRKHHLYFTFDREKQIIHDITTYHIEKYLRIKDYTTANFRSCLYFAFKAVVFDRLEQKYERKRVSLEGLTLRERALI